MNKIEENFLWVTVCMGMFFVHLSFVVLDVNIYEYLFGGYVTSVIGIVLFAAIVLSQMEAGMKEIGPRIAMYKYQRILSSSFFWGWFAIMLLALYAGMYSLGQFFLSQEHIHKCISDRGYEWYILFPFALLLFLVSIKALRSAIREA